MGASDYADIESRAPAREAASTWFKGKVNFSLIIGVSYQGSMLRVWRGQAVVDTGPPTWKKINN